MPTDSQPAITQLLQAWSEGDPSATENLIPLVYDQLRRLAGGFLSGERPGHTLPPTALVHEAYLRLVVGGHPKWQNRAHFFAIAARNMRRILVEHARAHRYQKRGGGLPTVSLDSIAEPAVERGTDLVALDDALRGLAEVDAEKARIVELRYFGGLSVTETAAAVGCSRATVLRQWRMAKAWLLREYLGEGHEKP
jgi:RNA polymerase sigma-70 factor (ECF subfamily)